MSQKLAKIEQSTGIVDSVVITKDDVTQEAIDNSDRRESGFDYIIETAITGVCSKGYLWLPESSIFVQPSPYPSWSLDENNEWQAPVIKPAGDYDWNEETQTWDPIIEFIDVNSADETELQNLDGVGPSTSSTIILERNTNGLFTSLLNLSVRVDGVSAVMADGWTNAYVGEVA